MTIETCSQRGSSLLSAQNTISLNDRIDRKPFYVDGVPDKLFGWYHSTVGASFDCVAVICSPLGHEYIHSHRSVRHLADHLAISGIPAVRFDYSGMGDSSGTDLDPARWDTWQANIRTVAEHAKQLSGRTRICLIGVHLGATLAALVASNMKVDLLVLWNAAVSGRRYCRELQAIALTAGQSAFLTDGSLESAGFYYSAQTIESLKLVNLLELDFKVTGRILLVERDDLAHDPQLCDHFSAQHIPYDQVICAGYHGMMAEPHFTAVPVTAIAAITDWALSNCVEHNEQASFGTQPALQMTSAFVTSAGDDTIIEEICCHYGGGSFGVACRPVDEQGAHPMVVMFNSGCVHHVGPSRLYVTLARFLAKHGFPSFRVDLDGIGDSIVAQPLVENHPYPPTAVANAGSALEYLRDRFSAKRFILVGLCSGAHTAFHAGLEIEGGIDVIPEIVLINPLTFHWVEGMSLETSRRFQQMAHYKGSLRNVESWKKLLRGEANFGKIAETVRSYLQTKIKSMYRSFHDIIFPHTSTKLSRELQKLLAMRRHVTFFISEGDPGEVLLMAEARRTAIRAFRSGQMEMNFVAGADHTFSSLTPRMELVECLTGTLATRYSGLRGRC